MFADGVAELSTDPRGERCVRARRPIPCGSLILRTDFAAYVLRHEAHKSRCSFCFVPAASRRCSRCQYARYCDEQCARNHWRAHRVVCSFLAPLEQLESDAVDPCDALLLRLALAADKTDRVWNLYDSLVSGQANSKDFQSTLALLPDMVPKDALPHLVRFSKNNFGIQTELLSLCGQAISPLAAMLNHACVPNACCHTRIVQGRPPEHRIYATRDIAEGEEICHAYLQLSGPLAERRANIQRVYRFRCKCSACEHPDPVMEAMLSTKKDADPELLHRANLLLRQSLEEDDLHVAIDHARKAVACRLMSVNSPENPIVTSALTEVVQLLMMAGRMEEAAEDISKVCAGLEAVLGTNHPLTGTQLHVWYDLTQNVEIGTKAYRALSNSYGKDHPMCLQLDKRIKMEK